MLVKIVKSTQKNKGLWILFMMLKKNIFEKKGVNLYRSS